MSRNETTGIFKTLHYDDPLPVIKASSDGFEFQRSLAGTDEQIAEQEYELTEREPTRLAADIAAGNHLFVDEFFEPDMTTTLDGIEQIADLVLSDSERSHAHRELAQDVLLRIRRLRKTLGKTADDATCAAWMHLGALATRLHVLPYEPHAERGVRRQLASIKGGKTRSRRVPDYQADVDAYMESHPAKSYTHACRQVAKSRGKSLSTILKYTEAPKRPDAI